MNQTKFPQKSNNKPQYYAYPADIRLEKLVTGALTESGLDPSPLITEISVNKKKLKVWDLKSEEVAIKIENSHVAIRDDYNLDIKIYISHDSGQTGALWPKQKKKISVRGIIKGSNKIKKRLIEMNKREPVE